MFNLSYSAQNTGMMEANNVTESEHELEQQYILNKTQPLSPGLGAWCILNRTQVLSRAWCLVTKPTAGLCSLGYMSLYYIHIIIILHMHNL